MSLLQHNTPSENEQGNELLDAMYAGNAEELSSYPTSLLIAAQRIARGNTCWQIEKHQLDRELSTRQDLP